MSGNPYELAARRIVTARRRVEGLGVLLAVALPPLVGLAAGWLARGSLYRFLDGQEKDVGPGVEGLAVRLGLLLASGLSLSTYTALVRAPDRAVIDLHPLRAHEWYVASLRQLFATALPWLGAAWLFLTPLYDHPRPLAAAVLALGGAWLAGLGFGAGVNLAAPIVAQDPRWAGLLDAIRGSNPRLQAALIWAPGVALTLSGLATLAGTWGAGRVAEGDTRGFLALAVPIAGALVGVAWGRRGAAASDRTPAVLGEIEAAHAEAEGPEEARRVYLEWAVRFAPRGMRRDLLRELRHAWRGLRVWVTGSWAAALAAAVAGWGSAGEGPGRFVQVAGAGLVIFGVLGIRLGATDPPRLAADLGLSAPRLQAARAAAVFGVLGGVVVPGAALHLVRAGAAGLPAVGALLGAAGVVAALGAVLGDRAPERGIWVYLPAGGLLWVALVQVAGGGG